MFITTQIVWSRVCTSVPGATLEEGEASSDDDHIEDQLTYAAERIEDDTDLKLHSLSNQTLWARCLCCTRHMFHSKIES